MVLLLEDSTIDNVELAIKFLEECAQKLFKMDQHRLDSIFSTLKNLSNKLSLDKGTRDIIGRLFAQRSNQFKSDQSIPTGLDTVHENNQYKHMLTLTSHEPDLTLGMNFIQI